MQPNACSIALFDGQSVLLIQRAFQPFQGKWTLPGGRREPGESAKDCVRRELLEETGLAVIDPVQVLIQTVGTRPQQFQLAVFAAYFPRSVPVPSDEVLDWGWVELSDIGGYATTDGLPDVLETCVKHLRNAGGIA